MDRVATFVKRITPAALLAGFVVGLILSVDDTIAILDTLSKFAWPAVAAWAAARLLPVLRDVVRRTNLQFEIAGVKVRLEQVIEGLTRQVADISQHIEADGDRRSPTVAAPPNGQRHLLWVDDRPEGNALEMKSLEEAGWRIHLARSTREAAEKAAGDWSQFDVVITDLGREESGDYIPDAGIQLTRRIREQGGTLPIFVYTSRRGWARRPDALEAGATDLTSSPVELLRFVNRAHPDMAEREPERST